MANSSQLDLIRAHRTEVRDLLARFGFAEARASLALPTRVIALPDAEVSLGDLLDAQDAMNELLLADIELVSARSELGRDVAAKSVSL